MINWEGEHNQKLISENVYDKIPRSNDEEYNKQLKNLQYGRTSITFYPGNRIKANKTKIS
jgi:hypothetical protein